MVQKDIHRCVSPPFPLPHPQQSTYLLSFWSRGSGRSLHKYKEICKLFIYPRTQITSARRSGKAIHCIFRTSCCMYRGLWHICLSRQEWLGGRGLGSGPVPRIGWLSTHSCVGLAFLSLDFWLHPCLSSAPSPTMFALPPLQGPRPCHCGDCFYRLLLELAAGHCLALSAGQLVFTAELIYRPIPESPPTASPCVCLQRIQRQHPT